VRPVPDPGLTDLLGAGCRRLGLAPTAEQVARLAAYAEEVARWGRRINLTGARDAAGFARTHILDSVSILPLLDIRPGQSWADVGSGAGVPGIPLAILTSGTRWLLVEPRAKRWAFLTHAVHALGLDRVEVLRARVADAPVPPGSLDGVVSRALGAPALGCHGWLRPGGLLALCVGPDSDRWPAVPAGTELTEPDLRPVPGATGRHLLCFRKGEGAGNG
jgi:16S rRNA (guanine527-N7)-methyltransferase